MVRKFKESDMPSLNKWLKKQQHPLIQYWELPAIGFIVPGVAIGFLRQCEGHIGIFDGLTSNPVASSATRHKALDAIFTRILEEPGFTTIIGYTQSSSAHARAQRHSFKPVSDRLLVYRR